MHQSFIIIGGGPVGLWTAIQLKKRQPACDVCVYERHESYQRHHVLRVDHWSMLVYNRQHRKDEHEEAFYRSVTDHSVAGITWRPAGSVALRTSDLEEALEHYAHRLGIHRVQEAITDPHALMARHPECHHFIAADGARSDLRTQLWPAPAIEERPLQHIVELKYQVEGPVDRSRSRLGREVLHHMAFDHVGRTRAGHTPVTVRLFLAPAEHAAFPESSFKAPLCVTDLRLPLAIRQDLLNYLRVRHHEAGEAVCPQHAVVTKLVLSLYAATAFARKVDGRNWFLVGDAAMGVPYFRSLNSGLIMGSRLAQLLSTPPWVPFMSAEYAVQRYNRYRPWHVATEFTLALAKDAGINAYEAWRQTFQDQHPDARLCDDDRDWPALWSPDCQAQENSLV